MIPEDPKGHLPRRGQTPGRMRSEVGESGAMLKGSEHLIAERMMQTAGTPSPAGYTRGRQVTSQTPGGVRPSAPAFVETSGVHTTSPRDRASPPTDKPQPTAGARRTCNCRKSNCLKLYCDCFASGDYCGNCNCNNCFNNQEHEIKRKEVIRAIVERNPTAFRPKIATGCSMPLSPAFPTVDFMPSKHSKVCTIAGIWSAHLRVGLCVQEVGLSQEVLRMFPCRDCLLRELQVHILQERRRRPRTQRHPRQHRPLLGRPAGDPPALLGPAHARKCH
jgi:hypothetical protein